VHLVQVLVPVYDNDGQPFPANELRRIRQELTGRFGGVTAYTRAPAEGSWEDDQGRVHHDDVAVIEVMVESLDREWWSRYREELAARFRQTELVVRATPLESL
jgi:hypothetical protein